ncbi:hypothetical protein PAMP_002356 [Pampus punctatissimus]
MYIVNSYDFPNSDAEQPDSKPAVQKAPTQTSEGQRHTALRGCRRRHDTLRRREKQTFKTAENSLSLEQRISSIVLYLKF